MSENNNHECGCGCDHNDHEFEEMETITLTLEDDSELECGVLGIFDVPTENREYIALVNLEDEQVLLYRYIEDENDQEVFELGSIETDEEFERVSNVFQEIFVDEDVE
ncbi:MAG: DUF1292 domain-containing protein [Miniphocaeibacter sp.]|uniref:DUF1292 domain-containing protein n=1 Tax=Miniphocaeibacter sp. TaxID=3100973 RepID=UPI003BB10540